MSRDFSDRRELEPEPPEHPLDPGGLPVHHDLPPGASWGNKHDPADCALEPFHDGEDFDGP